MLGLAVKLTVMSSARSQSAVDAATVALREEVLAVTRPGAFIGSEKDLAERLERDLPGQAVSAVPWKYQGEPLSASTSP